MIAVCFLYELYITNLNNQGNKMVILAWFYSSVSL